MLVLRAAAQIVDGIQHGLAERGFADVRPALSRQRIPATGDPGSSG